MSEYEQVFNTPEYGDMIQIHNVRLYDLNASIAAAKYPMQVDPNPGDDELTATLVKLAQCDMGTGHDN